MLTGLTVGKSGGITSIEAKVQTCFSYIDCMNAILDPASMLLEKINLGLFLYHAIIEVEMMIVGLEKSACTWTLLKSFDQSLASAADDIDKLKKYGWSATYVSKQKIE